MKPGAGPVKPDISPTSRRQFDSTTQSDITTRIPQTRQPRRSRTGTA